MMAGVLSASDSGSVWDDKGCAGGQDEQGSGQVFQATM